MNEQTNGLGREIYEKATEYIDSIAAGLGVAAEHVYGVMARQMVVEGIVYTAVWMAVAVILTLSIVKMARLTVRKWDDLVENDTEDYALFAWIVGGVAAICTYIPIFIYLPTEIMKIFNPEYYVIREIIGIFGGGS